MIKNKMNKKHTEITNKVEKTFITNEKDLIKKVDEKHNLCIKGLNLSLDSFLDKFDSRLKYMKYHQKKKTKTRK